MQPQVPMSPRCHPSPPTSSWFPKEPLCTAEGKSSYISTPPTMSLGPAATGEATQTSCILGDLSGEDGCVCVCVCVCVLVTQLCLTHCNLIYCSLPVSSVHGIIHPRKLDWVAMLLSRRSSWPRNRTRISCISGEFFTVWATSEAQGRRLNIQDRSGAWTPACEESEGGSSEAGHRGKKEELLVAGALTLWEGQHPGL